MLGCVREGVWRMSVCLSGVCLGGRGRSKGRAGVTQRSVLCGRDLAGAGGNGVWVRQLRRGLMY